MTLADHVVLLVPIWVLVIGWGMLIRPGRERWAVAMAAAVGVAAYAWSNNAELLFRDGLVIDCIAAVGCICLMTISVIMRVYCLQLGWQFRQAIEASLSARPTTRSGKPPLTRRS